MEKQSNWIKDLETVLASYRKVDFVWGKTDCALFVCDCLSAIYNKDFAQLFRNTYDSELGAYKALECYSKSGLYKTIDNIAKINNFKQITIPFASTGDITYGPYKNMGIVIGSRFAFMSKKGYMLLNISKAEYCWTAK